MCERCAMPLVHAEGDEQEPLGRSHEQARKIHPRFARGELVRVAVARNLSEAELIKGVLLEQGIPSLLRRTAGFDVPDFLAAGPRDVLVPEAGAEEARSLLTEVDAEHAELGAVSAGWEEQALESLPAEPGGPDPDASSYPESPDGGGRRSWELRLGAGLLIAVLVFGAVVGIVYALLFR
jgi:hypothetical protein